ncbi:MAG TPA: T9SS type A sorting domain-containing protein [Bacteroidota bacterium]|nr:T9SS type A sorting domain-containing protein [Bacteroidota bacterium]
MTTSKVWAGLLCLTALCSPPVFSQITISASDVGAQLAPGAILTNHIDTVTTSANIGSLGSTSWDFHTLLTDSTTVLTSVAVGSTPYSADFPGATNAFELPFSYAGFSGTAYQYLILNTNLLNPGNFAGISLGALGSATVSTSNSPSAVTYALPSTLGTSWTAAYTATQVITINGSLVGSTPTSHNQTYLVDAYGPMTIPGGAVIDALRIRKVETAGGKVISYIFLARNGASVQLTAADTSQPSTGTISVSKGSISWSGPISGLPIQLVSFTVSADPVSSRVLLKWSTLSETNDYGFTIQKANGPNGDFQTLPGLFVPGHGTTTVPQQYACTDNAPSAGIWYYRLKQMDLDGSAYYSDALRIAVAAGDGEVSTPEGFSLLGNFPNPFNPSTIIRISLPVASRVTLRVFNLLGQEVATLIDEERPAGIYDVPFAASGLASGVYICRMQAGSFTVSHSLTLLK